MPETFTIKVEGVKELERAFAKFPVEVKKNMLAAGKEASARVLLPTQGLQKYPPFTAANQPPEPYYIRGRGTQTKKGNLANSERLGTQWYTKTAGSMGVEIGNRASYAQYVHGENQAHFMGPKGWRKLVDVAKEKTPAILAVFDKWVKYTLKKVGL